jgi:TonB family protein
VSDLIGWGENVRLSQAVLLLSVLVALSLPAKPQESERPLPKVVEHTEPTYPALCRMARISGDVLITFTTDGQSVIRAEADTGHELLRQSAVQNVRTWKFVAHDPGTFHVTFRYKIQSDQDNVVFLPSSAVVEIATPTPIISIDWAWLDRGRWKAQMKSARESSQRILEIQTSGPKGKWLKGDMISEHDQKEEIDDGYFDEDRNMFAFTVKFRHPKGEPLNTSFIGKMSGDKILGTFVDDTGTTGTWTAVLESSALTKPKSR